MIPRNRVLPLVALVISAVLAFGSPGPASSDSGREDVVPGEVLVKLVRAEDLAAVAAANQLDPLPLGRFGAQPIFRLRILDGADPSNRAAALAADSRVVYAEPNFQNAAPRDRQDASWASGLNGSGPTATAWAAAKIGLDRAQRVSRGGGITIAVLDTGVDGTHPALAGHVRQGFDFVDLDADPSEEPGGSAYGHGTHVAGIIAAVAPAATILPVRVLDPNGVGNVWVLAQALRYALDPDGNADTDDGAQVVNLSISTLHRTRLLREVVDSAGPVIVAAAGNGANTEPEYPAAENVDGLISVGASTQVDDLAPFSSRGSWVRVAAPGVAIPSSVPGGGYAAWSGTSMSTALVAGEAALVAAVHPTWTSRAVAERIERSAVRIRGDVSRRIDAGAAVQGP